MMTLFLFSDQKRAVIANFHGFYFLDADNLDNCSTRDSKNTDPNSSMIEKCNDTSKKASVTLKDIVIKDSFCTELGDRFDLRRFFQAAS